MGKGKCLWSLDGICQAYKDRGSGRPLSCDGYFAACFARQDEIEEIPKSIEEWCRRRDELYRIALWGQPAWQLRLFPDQERPDKIGEDV